MLRRALPVLALLLLLPSALGLVDEAALIERKITEFVGEDDLAIIMGAHASAAERAAFAYFKDRDARIRSTPLLSEGDAVPPNATLFLIGGPRHNGVAAELLAASAVAERVDATVGSALFLDGERKAVVFSDYAGFENYPRRPGRSPLAKIIPEKYVPLAATGIGFLLLWLWQFFGAFAVKVGRFVLSGKLMARVKKRAFRHDYRGLHVKGVRLKPREWLAILLAAAVFAVSLGYAYLAPDVSALAFFGLTILVNFVVYAVRHLARLVFDRHHDLHTEYHVWWTGLALTALTGWLGNTFSLAGYVASADDKGAAHEARIAYWTNVCTVFAFVVFWLWNVVAPALWLQMAALLSLGIAYLQMLPMAPFAGKKIYAWKRWAWWLTFTPMTILYIAVNLVL